VFAQSSESKGGQFEVNALYGHTDSKMGDLNSYGGTVAGGFYSGNHLVQLETGAMISEDLGFRGMTDSYTDPAKSTRSLYRTFGDSEVQDIPVWFNYRYGMSFGPKDMFRFEAGPLIGFRVSTFRFKYGARIVDSDPAATSPQNFSGNTSQSGHLVFDYGAAAMLRCRFTEQWSLNVGYRYVRSSKQDFKVRLPELDSASVSYYDPNWQFPEHGTHYASVGVEYRF
jgi:opacity protein-like surface antigen